MQIGPVHCPSTLNMPIPLCTSPEELAGTLELSLDVVHDLPSQWT